MMQFIFLICCGCLMCWELFEMEFFKLMIYLDVIDLLMWIWQYLIVIGIQCVYLNYVFYVLGKGVKFVMFYGCVCEYVGLVNDVVIQYMGWLFLGWIEFDFVQFYKLCLNVWLKLWWDYCVKYFGQLVKYVWYFVVSGVEFYLMQLLFQCMMFVLVFKLGDVLFNVGCSWIIGGYVQNIEKLKFEYGILVQLLVYDVILIENGQKFVESWVFIEFIKESFQVFDWFFISLDYNWCEISRFMCQFIGVEKLIEKCLFGQNINLEGVGIVFLFYGLLYGWYLLLVGWVIVFKNQLCLLQVWVQVIVVGQDVGFWFVIVGKVSKGYRVIDDLLGVDLVLWECVLFLGDVFDVEFDLLYCGCCFMVFLLLIEGYGFLVVELISYGKFCLVLNVIFILEVVGEYVGYFDLLDVDDICVQLVWFIQDEVLLYECEVLICVMFWMIWVEVMVDLLEKVSWFFQDSFVSICVLMLVGLMLIRFVLLSIFICLGLCINGGCVFISIQVGVLMVVVMLVVLVLLLMQVCMSDMVVIVLVIVLLVRLSICGWSFGVMFVVMVWVSGVLDGLLISSMFVLVCVSCVVSVVKFFVFYCLNGFDELMDSVNLGCGYVVSCLCMCVSVLGCMLMCGIRGVWQKFCVIVKVVVFRQLLVIGGLLYFVMCGVFVSSRC